MLKRHVSVLASDSLRGRKSGTVAGRMAERYIVQNLQSCAGELTIDSSRCYVSIEGKKPEIVRINNVCLAFHGSDTELADEWIVVGAHYDHIGVSHSGEVYNGANDNAVSAAAMVEIAKNFEQGRRSVMFVWFDAEELGLLGSQNFVDRAVLPINQIKLVVVSEMIGHYDRSKMVSCLGLSNFDHSSELLSAVESGGLTIDTVQTKESFYWTMSTDTAPFYRAGVPTLLFLNASKENYHRPSDDPHTIDYTGLAKTTGYIGRMIKTMADLQSITRSEAMEKELQSRVGFEGKLAK